MSPTSTPPREIAVIGGGAAGFYAALTAAETDPRARVTIYERGSRFLTKVKISGGGRCNVTHHCFDPAELARHYPRGSRELQAAFHRWQPRDTIDWFQRRGVRLKTEEDGRIFPTTDDAQTIIDCFFRVARETGVELRKGIGIDGLTLNPQGRFVLTRSDDTTTHADAVCVALGSPKASSLLRALAVLGHTIEPPAPSLFAFNVADRRLADLAGIAVPRAAVTVLPKARPQHGPLLITHRGLSGPAILRTSAWEARLLHEHDYNFAIAVNWLGERTAAQVAADLKELRRRASRKNVRNTPLEPLPRRLWERLVHTAGIPDTTVWAHLPRKGETALIEACTASRFQVSGKTTNKDEFVTCGGIRRREIDFRTMESKRVPNLYFAGECIDLDGITGGFNFQAAWTTGHIAGQAMGNHPR